MPLDIVPQRFASIFPLEVTQRIVNVTMTAMSLHHLGQRICNTVEFRTAQLSDFSAGQVHVVSGREHFVSFSWSAFRHDAKPIVTRNRLVVGLNSSPSLQTEFYENTAGQAKPAKRIHLRGVMIT